MKKLASAAKVAPLCAASLIALAGCAAQAPEPSQTMAQAKSPILKGADPSVIRDGAMYYAVKSGGNHITVRAVPTLSALDEAPDKKIWGNKPNVWAPEIMKADDIYYVYFAAGEGLDKRMFVIASRQPDQGYSAPKRMSLPDDKWAIDGLPLRYKGQWWFVWSGWAGDEKLEQNLYIARMSDPLAVTGERHLISQPREGWERSVGNPYINEGPQPIADPDGQLHIVYSANGSWSSDYCLADLRLRAGGDPANRLDWYKSGGCLFGAKQKLMAPGVKPVPGLKGVGHHGFVLPAGDINASPAADTQAPFIYHGVPADLPMNWANRYWYSGSMTWQAGVRYCRNENDCSTGWSLHFHE
jgi:GH43 family beta-xylosidase